MTSSDLKKQFLNAVKEAEAPLSIYHEIARNIVNIERQSFYGDEKSIKRLGKIREEIDRAVKMENKE